MNTLTELHVPHHHHSHHLQHHHHNLLSNPSDIYLSSEQQQHQQLIQINSMLHKHENPLLQSTQQSQDQMLLYQVSQSGQILELNQIHQQQTMGNRLYKNDMVEIDGTVPLPAMHAIQTPLNTALNENLTIIGGENFQRNLTATTATSTTTSSDHLATDQVSCLTHVKKRKGGERGENAKSYKSESSEFTHNFFKFQPHLMTLFLYLEKNYHNSKNKKKQLIHHHPIADSSLNNDEIADDKKRDPKIPTDHFHDSSANNNENKNMNFTSTTSSSVTDNAMSKGNESGSDGSQIQCIRFSSFQQHQWHTLLDHNHQEL